MCYQKAILLIVGVWLTQATQSTLPYKEVGEMDLCIVQLKAPDEKEHLLYLTSNSDSKTGIDTRDGEIIGNRKAPLIYTKIEDSPGKYFFADTRPYPQDSLYYIEYPVGILVNQTGTYTISPYLQNFGKNPAVTVLYLYDKKEHAEQPVANLLEESYSVGITAQDVSAGEAYIDNRFFIRMYGVHLSKEKEEGFYTDGNSWQGGKVPLPNSHVMVLPTSRLTIKSGEVLTIGALTNSGYIENNGTLTVLEGAELLPGE